MKIEAAVARQDQAAFSLEALDLEAPRPDEILVCVAGVGLCHTDLVFKAGAGGYRFPAVLGHEGSGTVEQIGAAVTKVAVGDRVAMTFRSCGACDRCLAGDAAYCRTMPLLNYIGARPYGSVSLADAAGPVGSNFFGQSSFASHALTYERNVVKLPDDVPLELMGPLGCGIQTGVGGILRSLDAKPGTSLLITGGGAVGLSAVMGARIAGCTTIILVEPHANRRAIGIELGATDVIDPAAAPDLAAAVRATVPTGVDYAFDTTGLPPVLQALMQCLGSKGTLGIVGIAPPGTPVPGDLGQLMTFGHTVKGIIEGDSDPDVFIPELIGWYKAGKLPFDRLIKTYPLSAINDAVRDVHDGTCIKAVLLPGQ